MSATFPLLKLPYLCIEAVVKNAGIFEIIYFALISNRTRRIVKRSHLHLNRIQVSVCDQKTIRMGAGLRAWHIIRSCSTSGAPLVLQKDASPLYTKHLGHSLFSTTPGNDLLALKSVMDLLNDLFKCSILHVTIRVDNFQKPINFGVTTTNSLQIEGTIPVGTPEIDKILENIQVTSGYLFNVPVLSSFTGDTSKKMFNCRKGLLFENLQSAYWVTRNVFRQLRVPQVIFKNHEFSPNRAVDFVTEWFNSKNRKLKCLYMPSKKPILRRHFKIDHLNPMPFCEKRRSRHAKLWPLANTDLSGGFDILRGDGLLATILIKESLFALYVWHKRF